MGSRRRLDQLSSVFVSIYTLGTHFYQSLGYVCRLLGLLLISMAVFLSIDTNWAVFEDLFTNFDLFKVKLEKSFF